MAEHLPVPSDLIPHCTEDGQTRIEVRLFEEKHSICHQQCLKQEAEKEALAAVAELKKHLEGQK